MSFVSKANNLRESSKKKEKELIELEKLVVENVRLLRNLFMLVALTDDMQVSSTKVTC